MEQGSYQGELTVVSARAIPIASLGNLKLSKLCINVLNLSISAIPIPTTAPIPTEILPHAPIPIPIPNPQRTGANMVQISEVKGTNRDNRTAAHTHIKGLGLNNGVAEKQAAGFVGQTDAREVRTPSRNSRRKRRTHPLTA